MKYCQHCGAKKNKVESGQFNEDTGEKLYKYICPNNKCTISYCLDNFGNHDWPKSSIFSVWILGEEICKRCGRISYN